MSISLEEITTLSGSLADSFPILAREFEHRFTKWKATSQSGVIPAAQGPEWESLISMGQSIVPFVVHKLCQKENAFSIELYNKLQIDSSQKADPVDIEIYHDSEKRVQSILEYYSSLIATFKFHADAWEAHQEASSLSSNSHDYLDHGSYIALVRMGSGIVPLSIDRYARGQGGWWHELLFEITKGRKSGANFFRMDELLGYWLKWFQEGSDYTLGPPSNIQGDYFSQ